MDAPSPTITLPQQQRGSKSGLWMGIAAGGNINPDGVSMFEPIGGTAPSETGKGTINPLAAIGAMEMLLRQLRERGLAAYKMPDVVVIVREFPRTAVGKVSKRMQREA